MCGSKLRLQAEEYKKQGYKVIDTSKSREHRQEAKKHGLSARNKVVVV